MRIKVNPTRMALLRLRKRLVLARRGHKLLKDKLEGLIQIFMPLVAEYGQLRSRVDQELPGTLRLFILASATSGEKAVAEALDEFEASIDVEVVMRNVMSISVPELNLKGFTIRSSYSTVATNTDFDRASESLRDIFPVLLKLAALEDALLRMAEEIEKTRRRVNALEYVLIPSIQKTVKAISSKLDENDRSDRARLMKIKDMLQMSDSN
ncbi:MAG: V-type ATP synthase subunit D [Candidatus Latescibacter sp.]|nr:V-type ATP synthase subunit D [Candidatus Latescibacter sp.]